MKGLGIGKPRGTLNVLLILIMTFGFLLPIKIDAASESSSQSQQEIWTCSMHPQIRQSGPGKCPLCGMALIPLKHESAVQENPDSIRLTKEAAELANVATSVAQLRKPVKQIRLYGKVKPDERLLQSQVSHVSGRIDKLFVNFTGEAVSRGEPLAMVYSPELVTAQQELLEAAKAKATQPEIYEAAKSKLKQWELTEEQIKAIEAEGKARNDFEVVSNTDGVVINRRVNAGDHVAQGTVLYDIADLSKVWLVFDAYENDLEFLKKGDAINFTVQALPGLHFSGNIFFIDPVLNPVTRVATVRVEIENKDGRLKPEMFATGIVDAFLEEYQKYPVVPRSAVLWTGKRSVVYVKVPQVSEPVFNLREVELGPLLEDSYVVMKGLSEGEEVVTQGTFAVDASAELQGKPSMMNRGEEKS